MHACAFILIKFMYWWNESCSRLWNIKHCSVFSKNRLQEPFLVLRLGRGFITIFNSSLTYQRGEDVIAQVLHPSYHSINPFHVAAMLFPQKIKSFVLTRLNLKVFFCKARRVKCFFVGLFVGLLYLVFFNVKMAAVWYVTVYPGHNVKKFA